MVPLNNVSSKWILSSHGIFLVKNGDIVSKASLNKIERRSSNSLLKQNMFAGIGDRIRNLPFTVKISRSLAKKTFLHPNFNSLYT